MTEGNLMMSVITIVFAGGIFYGGVKAEIKNLKNEVDELKELLNNFILSQNKNN